MKSAASEAARSSTQGSGGASRGPASGWECRAAQGRRARPEEAEEPSQGISKGGGGQQYLDHAARPHDLCEAHGGAGRHLVGFGFGLGLGLGLGSGSGLELGLGLGLGLGVGAGG